MSERPVMIGVDVGVTPRVARMPWGTGHHVGMVSSLARVASPTPVLVSSLAHFEAHFGAARSYRVLAFGDTFVSSRFSWRTPEGKWPRLVLDVRLRQVEVPFPPWLGRRMDPPPKLVVNRAGTARGVLVHEQLEDAVRLMAARWDPDGQMIIGSARAQRVMRDSWRRETIRRRLAERGPWWETLLGWAVGVYALWKTVRQ